MDRTVEKSNANVEKLPLREVSRALRLPPKESAKAPKGFSDGKPDFAKPRGRQPTRFSTFLQGFENLQS